MSDDDEQAEEAPAVELGEGETVEGAPLARVTSRLTWPSKKSDVERKEGDAVIRTPDGPQPLADVLDDLDDTYFESRQHFTDEVLDAVGRGPVATE